MANKKISQFPLITTPADADFFPIGQNADLSETKRITWANVQASLKTYFDSIYPGSVARAASFVVASSEATALEIAQADYVCSGGDDNVQIQAALDALYSGNFTFSGLPSVDETLIIGDDTYTFKGSRSGAFEIAIGASASATADNMVTAFDADNTNSGLVASADSGVVTISGKQVSASESATNVSFSNNSKGKVVLSSGTFNISSTIVVKCNDLFIEGQGVSTLVRTDSGHLGIDIFSFGDGVTTNANLHLANFKISSDGQKTADNGIKINKCFKVWIDNVYIENQYRAIYILNSTQIWLNNLPIRDTKENGISIESDFSSGYDWYINGVVMDNPNVTNTGIGIDWVGGENLVINSCDVIAFNTGLSIVPTDGKQCRWAFFNNAEFDSSLDNNIHIGNSGDADSVGFTFTNCWTGTAGNYGVLIDKNGSGDVEGIRFNACKILHNGLAGIRMGGGSDIHVNDSDIISNSNNTPGSRSGIEVAGVSNFSIIDNFISNGWGQGDSNQDWGINIDSGSSNNFVIRGNDLRGNVSGGLNMSTTGPVRIIMDNLGLTAKYEIKTILMKNTSGGELAVGDVVTYKAVAAGDEVTTTTSQGDDLVFGMVTETIANDASGYVQTLGKTIYLKVDGTTDIAVGDYLGAFTTAKIAMKASAGDMAFAIALEAYTTDDSSGVIDAILIHPRKI